MHGLLKVVRGLPHKGVDNTRGFVSLRHVSLAVDHLVYEGPLAEVGLLGRNRLVCNGQSVSLCSGCEAVLVVLAKEASPLLHCPEVLASVHGLGSAFAASHGHVLEVVALGCRAGTGIVALTHLRVSVGPRLGRFKLFLGFLSLQSGKVLLKPHLIGSHLLVVIGHEIVGFLGSPGELLSIGVVDSLHVVLPSVVDLSFLRLKGGHSVSQFVPLQPVIEEVRL